MVALIYMFLEGVAVERYNKRYNKYNIHTLSSSQKHECKFIRFLPTW